MRVRAVAAATVVVGLAAGVVAAAPAQAYDRKAYEYAAGHAIERSDVPTSLGAMKDHLYFSGSVGGKPTFLCSVPQSDPKAPSVAVQYPTGTYRWSASYAGTGDDAPTIDVTVDQYASGSKAIAAWQTVKAHVSRCSGTGSTTWTDPDNGASTTYSAQVTNGVVPSVTTEGVPSLFVSQNSLDATTPGDSRYVNDQYAVYSLFGDTIITTSYFSNTNENLTSAQRRAVDRVAFNAETRWLG